MLGLLQLLLLLVDPRRLNLHSPRTVLPAVVPALLRSNGDLRCLLHESLMMTLVAAACLQDNSFLKSSVLPRPNAAPDDGWLRVQ